MGIEFSVIGDVNIDLILPIDCLPKEDLQIIVDKSWIQIGGSSAIFSLAASKLGCNTTFMGLLGQDCFSNFLINEMKEFGVNCRIKQKKEVSAGITCALVSKNMKRSMISYRGSNSKLSINDINFSCIYGDLLHIGGFNLLDNLRKDVPKIFRYTTKKKILTSLDPNWDPKGWTKERLKNLHEILPITDFFFPDLEEGKAITKFSEPKRILLKLLNYCNGIVALKLGDKGCLVGEGSKSFTIKPFKISVVHTTGSGDEFNAAVLANYLKTNDLRKSAVFASAAGALYATKLGKERFPTTKKILKLMSK